MAEAADITDIPGQRLAIIAEALYLVNLLLLPAVGCIILFWVYLRTYSDASPLARSHLAQTVRATMWAALLLIWVTILILAAGNWATPAAWTVALLHFLTVHTFLVLLGVIGLAKAMAGKSYRFPLVGVPCD
ncbi:hypothetical protein [Thiohalomonas denitrificans]|uniref:Cytochrome C oxidase subunit III n=1 Tax=Thiohalomonas denitrificans TaxID=415747 RepID=A0A1G5QA55_9GAMM|nr:hypothetical protein [Thiohalomonas denitrificans]SCZ58159.1 hypothetical protein SAMN03097708_01622 [Thiohalomonas denitrificans]